MARPLAFVIAAALVALLAAPAQAAPILDQAVVSTGGDVVVTFVSNGAGYTNELFLDGERGDELGVIFNNWTTAPGTSVNLGSFDAGTELVFKMRVKQTGRVFYTGDGSRNPDGLVHAVLQSSGPQLLVGFEDLFGGGDRDYNDLMFTFTNVAPVISSTVAPLAIDEPSTLLMLGGGLTMLVVAMRRRIVRR